MTQTAIPFVFMRGGTSRGPYFKRDDLPKNLDDLAQVLIAVLGAGHPLNIDGIGGGAAVTTKVAMLSKSKRPDSDIDYFFAQVSVDEKQVDFKPTCGNILVGVGPAAIEMGLMTPSVDTTTVRIHAVNTGAKVHAQLHTPSGQIAYQGNTAIDGVSGTAAAVQLQFMDVVGSSTGAFLPTGNLQDVIDGIAVSCMDVAMPLVIARATDFGLSGHESVAELDANKDFFARMEAIRLQAGQKMGMGDVSKSVTPKFGLLAKASKNGTIATRYFMPWKTHPTMAVTGGQCLAACALTAGTVASGLLNRPTTSPATLVLEHPSGIMEVMLDFATTSGFVLHSAGLVRTARKLAAGEVFVPSYVWKR